jgi:hypothetical protein
MSQSESKEKKQVSMADLKRENETLRHIIYEISWMARRYAHGRATYAPDMYNRAITAAVRLNVKLNEADHESVYADDGCLGKWVPEKQGFQKELGLPVDE